MKQKAERRSKVAKRIVFYGKIFIFLSVLLLIYLLWSMKSGYFGTDEAKWAKSQKIIKFSLPANYRISLVTNIPLAQVIVLDNTSTGQRLSIQRRLWPRKDRLPQGFIDRFNHPGKIVEFRTTFTGLKNPLILEHGNTMVISWQNKSKIEESKFITGHNVPYVLVEDRNKTPIKRGLVACLYCPVTKKSYYITSSAVAVQFNPDEVIQFIQAIQCH
ncbi:MAG: hypothetical protein QME64_01850 [bacterium]|nr:hypothetical protein [bacterium]